MRRLCLLLVLLLGLFIPTPMRSNDEGATGSGDDTPATERSGIAAGKSGPATRPDIAPGLPDAGVDDSPMDSPDDRSQPATDRDGQEPEEQTRPTDDPPSTAVKTEATAADRKSSPGSDSKSTVATAGRVPDSAKAKVEEQPSAPAAPEIRLSPELRELGQRIRRCLAFYYYRPESATERSPWGVMHYAIGFGVDAQLSVGDQNVNALAWLCGNRFCNGLRMLTADRRGVDVRLGPGYQGHEGQFLSVLALARVQSDYPLSVSDQKLTIADLVKREQRTCRAGTELTFKLIGLSHYLDSDAQWVASDGQRWDIPRLIREEIAQPVTGSACGGTHRLIGLAYAVNRREKAQRPVTGQWLRAKQYVASYQQYTFKLQNRDGSFSTKWFEGRAHSGDLNRYLNTTGHALEWLTFSLPKEQLTDPRLVRMASFLENLMWENRTHRWDIGPKGHGLRALSLYDEYLFGGQPGQRAVQLAETLRDKRLR